MPTPKKKVKSVNSVEKEEEIKAEFFPFEYLNDTKHDIIVRQTPTSYPNNPGVIKPLQLVKLYIRPGGFMKLWDYTDTLGHYHLLVI